MAGFFITFEGGEGAGKTTQIELLAAALAQKKLDVLRTREPGGTPEGNKIRALIVEAEPGQWTPMAECLLMLAARDMHVSRVIKPALNVGKIVICDRFSDSTMAYQGYGHGLGPERVARVIESAACEYKPDLTIILDIEPAAGLARAQARYRSEAGPHAPLQDRYETLDLAFHQRVREGFLNIARLEPERCVVVNAQADQESIAATIAQAVLARLNAKAQG